MRKLAAILLCIAAVSLGVATSTHAVDDSGAPLVIDEVQAGTSNYRDEFVLLYNRTDAAIDLEGYTVSISSAAGEVTAEISLTGELAAYGQLHLISESYYEDLQTDGNLPSGALSFTPAETHALAKGGGQVVLESMPSTVVDMLGYGAAQGFEAAAAPELPSNYALKRCTDLQGLAVDTEDNSSDFVLTDTPLNSQPGPVCDQLKEPEEPEEPTAQCTGVVLSEILPNAAGADGGNEFIEIHNPTEEVINLHGCYLQLGSKEYHFSENAQINASEYRAFYDSETGITLPNSAGGEVMLVTNGTEEIVKYPGGLDDDVSLALIEDEWQQTYEMTPNATNKKVKEPVGGKGGGLKPCGEGKYRHPETNRCRKIDSGSNLKPCREGQERNPATNRCRSISGSSRSLVPCKPGQERNPATNRCKSIASSTSSLKPCKPNQFRNPETNRCKKKDSGNDLKPCKEGWERNPETNRCRKKRDAAEPAFAVEETPPSAGSQIGWWAAGAVGAGAIGYGAFEWRREIAAAFRRLRIGRGKDGPPAPESE